MNKKETMARDIYEIKLHLACGPNIVKGWQNIDILDSPEVQKHDLKRPLPYESNTVNSIFHEHFIEHLTKEEAEKFLKECYRVLKPGSAMRIGWPDLAKLIRAYILKTKKYRDYVVPHLESHRWGNDWDEILSDCIFGWEHRYAYTDKHLTKTLESVGFQHVSKKKYKQSNYSIALDFRNDPATTYLEMIK